MTIAGSLHKAPYHTVNIRSAFFYKGHWYWRPDLTARAELMRPNAPNGTPQKEYTRQFNMDEEVEISPPFGK